MNDQHLPPAGHERRRGEQPPIKMLHVITRMIRGGADENTLAQLRARYPQAMVVQKPVAMQALWTAVRSAHAHATKKSARADDR